MATFAVTHAIHRRFLHPFLGTPQYSNTASIQNSIYSVAPKLFAILAPVLTAIIYLAGILGGTPEATLVAYAAAYLPLGIFVCRLRKTTEQPFEIRPYLLAVGIAQSIMRIGDPVLSEDVWRYVWDGFRVGNGHNPYCLAPSDITLDEFASQHHLASVRGLIGHAQYPTIYPPLAQGIFSVSSLFSPSSLPIRILGIGASLGSVYCLYCTLKHFKIPTIYVGLMAAHPLFLVETAVTGHVDAFGVFFLTLALYCVSMSWEKRGMFFVALATLTKLIPFLVVPFIFRSRFKALLAVSLMVGGCYAFLWSDSCSPLGSLSTFSGKWQHNAGLVSVIEWLFQNILGIVKIEITIPVALSEWLVGDTQVSGTANLARFGAKCTTYILLLIASIWIWRTKVTGIEKGLMVLAALLLCVPVLHPWYLLWLLPGLPFLWHRGKLAYTLPLLWWSWTVLFAYVARVRFLIEGTWSPSVLGTSIEYVGLFVCLVIAYRSRLSAPSANQ